MSNSDLRKTILELALPLVEAQGLEIWGLELVDGPRLIVRLFVDGPLTENEAGATGATIAQCEEISRELELALDVGERINRSWILEVSSPGFERVFFNIDQLRSHVGDIVDVRLVSGLEDSPAPGRRNWRGTVVATHDDSFDIQPCSLSQDGDILPESLPVCHIPWASARRVNRVHIFKMPRKPGKQKA